ncbi:beta-L-arabinofuranosidase domain-containing protein [Xylanibacter rodentium]|uniref:beta-L-arabinofuranosidase domain-containing protein n=1 Tax=Xylanibacter rodentium TaxID=2736289 RepID=UPI00258B69C6|nr:beta-L-arabinofuranosidase domain-containing protein [Xylanibacter rodentium]
MKKTITIIAALSLACGNISALDYDKIPLKEEPVNISTIKNIGGFIGDRMRLNRNTYLKHFPIEKYVEFIEARNHKDWDWTRAEQHGKWLESAYLSAIQADDKALLDKAETMLHRIISSQERNGYLGATSAEYRNEERPVRGMDAYELYFVFHALASVYEQTGNEQTLHAAEQLADYYLMYFGPGKHEFWPSDFREPDNRQKRLAGTSDFAGHSVHYSWEGTLLCDPVARLYEITGKKKYLQWSKWVVDNIDRWSGWDSFSRLDSVASGYITVYDLQPYVHSHTFHMNFMGFLRLYRITGDASLLRKVQGAWDDIAKRQMYITGGVSVAEHYEHGHVKPISGHIVETCATMSWMQLTQSLLELTGNTKYADAMERLMINHVFAGQDAATGVCRYHTAPNGVKPEGYFHGPDCCTASGHRVISLLPTFLYAKKGNKLFVNQYLPSEYKSKDFVMTVSGNYPEDEDLHITIDKAPRKNKEINLRIPSWCENASVKVNGVPVNNVKSGKYLTLDCKWNPGDVIDITFPMVLKWVKRENHSRTVAYTLPDSPEILFREEKADRTPYALVKGPVIYSLDMVWNKSINNDDANFEKDIRIDTSVLPSRIDAPQSNMLGPAYKAKGQYKGKEVELTMTPFANTGIWYREGEDKPAEWSDAFSYGIWLYGK